MRSTDASPVMLEAARSAAASDFAAYVERGEACEDILECAHEDYFDRIVAEPRMREAGAPYDAPAHDAAQEYACAYTDAVRTSRGACPECCEHD